MAFRNNLTQLLQFKQIGQHTTSPMAQAFNNLSRRDQFALLGLTAFLLLFGFGFGGYVLHQKANASQKAYDSTLADVFWLRSQAGNIATSNGQASPNASKADTVRQILAQSGVTAQVVENGENIQLAFSHPQAAVVSNVFNQLTGQGVGIVQLQINQPSLDKVEVQAVLK